MWRSLLTSPPPTVGVEIAARRVTAVAIDRGGNLATVRAHATEPLPPPGVSLSVTATSIGDVDAIAAAMKRALSRVGYPKRVGLVVPDPLAKVSLLRFENVPSRPQEFEQLLRWQMRKTVPFPIEQAQVGWTAGAPAEDGAREFIVTAMRRELVEQCVSVCATAGAHAGIVDLASFNVLNAALAAERAAGQSTGDWLLVYLSPDYSTVAIVRGPHLLFYRTRQSETEGHLADIVHQTAMYYEDRLGGSRFARVVVAASDPSLEPEVAALTQTVEHRLESRMELLDPRAAAALPDRIAAAPELLASLAAPMGVIVRET